MIAILPLILAVAPVDISSQFLHYEKQALVLEGEVEIAHALATISADQARLPQFTTDQLMQPFELHGAVTLTFADESTLDCDHAFLDPEQMTGRFAGERVSYRESSPSTLKQPLTLDCQRMDVDLGMAETGRPLQGRLKQLDATGQVRIRHGHTFRAAADHARYLCQATASDLPPLLKSHYVGQESPGDLLTLEGNVRLTAHKIGTLLNDRRVTLVRTSTDIDCILATGKTELASTDEQPRRLVCPGDLLVDQQEQRAYLSGSAQAQVLYEDEMGGFSADEMVISYDSEQDDFTPTHILLTGGVCICNRILDGKLQYALADRVEYLPDTEEMTLSAELGRVLLLDEEEETRVSAKEIIVNRTARSIEGKGNVRFTLSDREMSLLRNLFGLENDSTS